MKFDVVIGNPPYNKSIKFEVPKSLKSNPIAYKAAQTRVDACFVVYSTEHLIKDDGIVSMVWPLAWLQMATWKDFREWAKDHTNKVTLNKSIFEKNLGVRVATTETKKENNDTLSINSSFFDKEYLHKFNGSEAIPLAFNDIAAKILSKTQNHKVELLSKKPVGSFVSTSTAIGELDDINNQKQRGRKLSIVCPLRVNKPGKYYITCSSQQDIDNWTKFWYEPLPSFIVSMYLVDWNASLLNVGQIPDVLAILKGKDYSRQLVYDELGLTKDEVEYLEQKVFDMFRIDGVQNRPEYRKQHNDKRKFNEVKERLAPLWP